MNEFKYYLIMEHKKEQHNLMVEEIKDKFICEECDLIFLRKSLLKKKNMENVVTVKTLERKV